MTLDLSKIDPPIWRVLIQSTAYGPYTLGQLQGFVTEGRIGLQTKIARGDGAAFVAAETLPELQPALRAKLNAKPTRRAEDQAETPHNYIIISRLTGVGQEVIIRQLNQLGSFGEAMPGVYVLRTKTKLSALQKSLNAVTTARDSVLIVDATSNRLGWFNLGPEADIHLRAVWDKKLEG